MCWGTSFQWDGEYDVFSCGWGRVGERGPGLRASRQHPPCLEQSTALKIIFYRPPSGDPVSFSRRRPIPATRATSTGFGTAFPHLVLLPNNPRKRNPGCLTSPSDGAKSLLLQASIWRSSLPFSPESYLWTRTLVQDPLGGVGGYIYIYICTYILYSYAYDPASHMHV